MHGLHAGTLSSKDSDVVRHLDLCLGCRACETACPSGVPYGNLIEVARNQINQARVRPKSTQFSRWALLETMTRPEAMTLAMETARRVTGGIVPPLASRIISDDTKASAQKISLPEKISPPLPPAFTPAVGAKRFRVGVLSGCVMRVLFGETNTDTVRVLAANGCEVLVNRKQGCCGALHLHNGQIDAGRELARSLIDAFSPFDGLDAIIVNSAGCGSTLKEYGHLFADDRKYAEKAAAFAAKVRDVSEFLSEVGWVAPLKPLREEHERVTVVVAYHDACHLAHGQQIREAPRELLSRIPGLTLKPLTESEICCGSAGIYNLTEPEMAKRLQQRKVQHILDTGASIVATGNPGCLAWIQSGLDGRDGDSIRVVHPVTLLAEALNLQSD